MPPRTWAGRPASTHLSHRCQGCAALHRHAEAAAALSQLVIYLATAPKSNSADVAYFKAREDAIKTSHYGVPLHIRNAPTKLMKELDYGKGYKYDHDSEHHYSYQKYFPKRCRKRPTTNRDSLALKGRSPKGCNGGKACGISSSRLVLSGKRALRGQSQSAQIVCRAYYFRLSRPRST